MTETPIEETTISPEETPAEPVPVDGSCRWCGASHEGLPGEDWLCDECGRYQDAMICPTCGGLARVSLMPAEFVPEAATPKKKGRK